MVICFRLKFPQVVRQAMSRQNFSGHYQTYGINVQAACDHKFRFVYAALAAPGGANEIAALRKTQLSQMIQMLPLRRFVVGGNVYVCSETLLTPFSGVEKDDPSKDAFNFYLSQMRIHIEQPFGLMTGKWRILCKPLQMHLKNVGKVFMCITRLHNFCFNEGNISTNSIEVNQVSDREFMCSYVNKSGIAGSSVLRDIIVQDLVQHGLERPDLILIQYLK